VLAVSRCPSQRLLADGSIKNPETTSIPTIGTFYGGENGPMVWLLSGEVSLIDLADR
jgi:hypothetical protein